jgi:hypothetical protein
MKKLFKNNFFLFNLIPAIIITLVFLISYQEILYIIGWIGLINWIIVIIIILKTIKKL